MAQLQERSRQITLISNAVNTPPAAKKDIKSKPETKSKQVEAADPTKAQKDEQNKGTADNNNAEQSKKNE